ncbi:MAG: hypothetical protein V2J42_08375 [Wenzhouxiangella sp.]|nr:hypothetical protein [Wenzhouxiangella sp.]
MSLTAFLAAINGLQTDGVLSLHFTAGADPLRLIGQGLINWLVLALCLLVLGRWLAPTRFATIDLLGAQAAARWPLLLSVLYLSFPPAGERIRQLTAGLVKVMPSQPGQVMADAAYMADAFILTALGLPLLVFLVWMVWLMFHGFSATTGLTGPRAVFAFAGGLILAQILSQTMTSLLI